MKKLFCLILSVLMLAGLTVPALASEMDQELESVTAAVVAALDVADDYTDFSGSWDDWLGGHWSLWWEKDGGSLSVTADENGKVLDVWCWEDSELDRSFYGFDPRFPNLEESKAQSLCADWLARLVTEPEAAVIESSRIYPTTGNYVCSGTVYINGVPAPITFMLTIRGDGSVLNYTRSDSFSHYVGDVPAAETSVTEADAAKKLADAVAFELYWVSDGEGQAALRYVPSFPRVIVDAESGESVDMDALYASFYETGMGLEMPAEAEAAMAMDSVNGGRGLTETELAAVDAYAHAKPLAELDAPLRAIAELGLDEGFVLENGDYSQNVDGDITVTLHYTKPMTEDNLYGYSRELFDEVSAWGEDMDIHKYITLDAKTGELKELWTNYPLWEKDDAPAFGEADADALGESFLQQVAPEKMAVSERCTLKNMGEYIWAQVEQGYFFPENYLELEINTAAGVIDRYHCYWNDGVEFASTDIVGEEAAKTSYADALTVAFGYVAWPVAVDDTPIFRPFIDAGYSWVESLKPAWYFDGRDEILGVDAVSGEVLFDQSNADAAFEYDDLESTPQRLDIEKLGRAGIGIAGGKFEPEAALDMKTAALLLVQTQGWNADAEDLEGLRMSAESLGVIEKGAWEPDAELNRMDFLHMLLCAGPYGEALKLEGAWSLSFWDKRSVDSAEQGHVAVARALGLVTERKYDFDAPITRAEAASMLCALMSR